MALSIAVQRPKRPGRAGTESSGGGGNSDAENGTNCSLGLAQTPVTAVTDRSLDIGETSIVNMVRGAGTKAFFEPGDTRLLWKGEAAASFV